ncbi:Putative zinc ribbon domain protein [Poriferisphaera corsica]|uniref:Zinc ribbon domain protein n=1 Tax=Poriferisphaera corsica TaxID=2528020 RepID=A0A517YVD1_9BACT|nr:C4-type zinc ribbon domain-containing protein [Poriferisphaera corsica]QDU34203.1 Putative zinc ribbon domain protein [Poriferisphaera corsica]
MSLQEDLYELFLLDTQVRGLRSRLDAAMRRQKAQQTKLDKIENQLGELRNQLKHQQSAAMTAEKESNEIDEKIKQSREQMNAVTSNKEYSALLVEVNTLKIDKGKAETVALDHLNATEETQKNIDVIEQQVDSQKNLVEAASKDVEEARVAVGDQLDKVEAERAESAKKIPTASLAIFDRLAYEHDGEALAEIEEQNRKRNEYTCGGCYMQLPIERISSTASKPNAITTCPTCGRILFMKTENIEALSGK